MRVLSKRDVQALLPHGESMCLLDAVEQWDAVSITCRTRSHRDEGNPLRRDGRLGIAAGLEYAAQAMGVHVGLLIGDRSSGGRIGYVGALREVVWQCERLDDLPDDVFVEATRLLDATDRFMYRFTVTSSGRIIMEGRASLFLKQPAA